MKNTNTTKAILALRANSIRNLTAAELRVVQGAGCNTGSISTPRTTGR